MHKCTYICIYARTYVYTYVCISMVLCSASYWHVLFITLFILSHQFICDCTYLFLLLLFTVSLLFRSRSVRNMCVCVYICLLPSAFLVLCAALFSLFTEQASSCLLPSRSVYIQCHFFKVTFEFFNFPCLLLTFSVLLKHAFGDACFVLVVLFSTSLPPPPHTHTHTPVFCVVVVMLLSMTFKKSIYICIPNWWL